MTAMSKSGASELTRLHNLSVDFAVASKSESTKSAYRGDWDRFVSWAHRYNLDSLPATPSTIRLWVTHLADAGKRPTTISRSLAAISQAHSCANLQTPTNFPDVTETMKGIRRRIGTSRKRAKPLILSELKAVVDSMRPTFLERRDTALLLLGWSAALRRSEIVSLLAGDFEIVSEGAVLTLSYSKTDQEGEGFRIGIPWARDERYCAARAVSRWIELARLKPTEPLFFLVGRDGEKWCKDVEQKRALASKSVTDVIKRRMRQAGLSTAGYSGHSLRAGFVTSAASAKIPEYLIQIHSRHRSAKSMRGYIRDGSLFSENSLLTLL